MSGPLRPRDVAPDDLDAPFWDACREQRFLVHRCGACGRAYWPASTCIDHGSAAMAWEDGSGRGEVHTYTVVHHAYGPDLADKVPYVLVVVRLDDGPFFHSDLVDCDPADVHVGMRVRAVYDPLDDDDVVPRFAPDPAPGAPGRQDAPGRGAGRPVPPRAQVRRAPETDHDAVAPPGGGAGGRGGAP